MEIEIVEGFEDFQEAVAGICFPTKERLKPAFPVSFKD